MATTRNYSTPTAGYMPTYYETFKTFGVIGARRATEVEFSQASVAACVKLIIVLVNRIGLSTAPSLGQDGKS